jgi:hypothetical protein
MNKATLCALSLLCAVVITGCATPASYQAMTVQPDAQLKPNPKLKGQISLGTVTGGKDTNPMWTSQVDNENFKKALGDSLAIAGYQPAAGQAGKYRLSAELQELDQPIIGLTFDVKSNIVYKLESTDSGASFNRSIPINATGTATTSDAFVAVERLRIANERSILENIKALLKQLQGL